MAKTLRIPDSQLSAVRLFAELDSVARANALEQLESVGVSTRPDVIATRLQSTLSVDETTALELTNLLTQLYALFTNLDMTPEEFGAALTDAVDRIPDAPKVDRVALQRAFGKLATLRDSVGVLQRARDVMTEHDHIWCHGRILTDLRPVFRPNDGGLIDGAVIIHNLYVHYRGTDEGGFYVALDRLDLLELQEIVERALQKHDAMVKLFGATTRILGQGEDL